MSTIVVASFENKKEAETVARFIRKFRKSVSVFKSSHWEDFQFGQLIEEGMNEGGEISQKEFTAFLDRKIKSLK